MAESKTTTKSTRSDNFPDNYAVYREEYDIRLNSINQIESCIIKILTDEGFGEELTITSRVKKHKSFVDKCKRNPGKYKDPFNEITDLTGIRIVAPYRDEVEKIKELLETKFTIDEVNSNNTQDRLDANSFGYITINLIATLTDSLADELHLSHVRNKKFEIQIRTHAQHAWAIQNRSLAYNKDTVSPQHIRRLALVAASLEQADSEFMRLRDEINDFKKENLNILEASKNNPISAEEISELLLVSSAMKDIHDLLKEKGFTILLDRRRNEYLLSVAQYLRQKDILDNESAERFFKEHAKEIARAIQIYLQENNRNRHALDAALTAALPILLLPKEEFMKRTSQWQEPWKSGVQSAYDKFHAENKT